jgi:eukaryotic-like serine/threonine-protein kinase
VRVKISPTIAVFPVRSPKLVLASLPLRLRMRRGTVIRQPPAWRRCRCDTLLHGRAVAWPAALAMTSDDTPSTLSTPPPASSDRANSRTSSFDFITVPENPEERRAFLQARVAMFGRLLAIVSCVFLFVSASLYFILTPNPSIVLRLSRDQYDFLAIFLMTALWAIARRGKLSKTTLELAEAGATVLACAGFALMVVDSQEEFNILVPVLAALAILMTRAVFIPTTPRRTALVSSLGAVPSIVVTYLLATKLDAHTSIPLALGPTVYVTCWAGSAVALSTITSRIIYGLEQKVREARQLGPYTLAERIGGGGMGVVYRANHAMLRRPTAVKVLPPERMGTENLRRFEREVQLTSQLTHPNTISIYDYGRTPDGLFYYAMEYLDGFTLTELVEATGPLVAPRVAWLMRQVAGSIDEAHRIGLIHRDIKPDNIMVCNRGGLCDVVKVLDFGLVKELKSAAPALSHAEAVVGTPLYMSPESITSPDTVGVPSDIYAFGAVAYYLAAGRHVFQAKTIVEVCTHHLRTAPESLSQATGGALLDGMESLIMACLAKDPSHRPQNAEELERALSAMIGSSSWTQDDARGWWRDHEDDLARLRAGRGTSDKSGEKPRIVRSTTLVA